MFCRHDWNKVVEETDSYSWEFKFCIKCGDWKSTLHSKVTKKLRKEFNEWVKGKRLELQQWMIR